MYRDPLHWKYVEVLQESHTSKRSSSKYPLSQSSSKSSRHFYMSQFPILLHGYIEDIIYAEPDGNYGFHVIVGLLGWGEESWSLVHT